MAKPINNKELSSILDLLADLKELHGADSFRTQGIRNAARKISKWVDPILNLDQESLLKLEGIGKSLANTIRELSQTDKIQELEELKNKTPKGIIRMLDISGLGPKKILIIWKNLGIESIGELRYACNENRLVEAKGFGIKTQNDILNKLDFFDENQGRYLYPKLENEAVGIHKTIEDSGIFLKSTLVGDLRRKMEFSDKLEILISLKENSIWDVKLDEAIKNLFKSWTSIHLTQEMRKDQNNTKELDSIKTGFSINNSHSKFNSNLNDNSNITDNSDFIPNSDLFIQEIEYYYEFITHNGIPGKLYFCKSENFTICEWYLTGSVDYVQTIVASMLKDKESKSLRRILNLNKPVYSELELFAALHIPFLEPELRENWDSIFEELFGGDENSEESATKGISLQEFEPQNKFPGLIQFEDIQGTLHNHSTYSDGINTLEEMVKECIRMGLNYFGISDHSKTAVYAKGLPIETVKMQWEEIDRLNLQNAPFKIFKGIESDILNDGQLDYADEILAGFDFVIASVHSNLKMDKEKAMKRLLRAIENPYTTILGHPTTRLLLSRPGYPLNMPKIIEACIQNQVVIEINANPSRLDIDWRWIAYGLNKGAIFSINPDAHKKEGLYDMRYGVQISRKGGLFPKACLNTFSANEIENYFLKKRKIHK